MTTLNAHAVREITLTFNSLTNTTATVAEYVEHYFPGSPEWGGDACGCTDDRCIGHHHDAGGYCGCLDALLDEFHDAIVDEHNRQAAAQLAEPVQGPHNTKSDERLRGFDPAAVDWPAHQAIAAVPFDVVNGLPRNPLHGQVDLAPARGGLRHWGEAVCSDAIVFAEIDGIRHLLLIERGDGHGWALPGGGLDAGETALQGCVRELAEETGLVVAHGDVEQMLAARVVPDPRAGKHAWMVTIPGVIYLRADDVREVAGHDDATDAAWFPAASFAVLAAHLAAEGREIFTAHVDLLAEVLG